MGVSRITVGRLDSYEENILIKHRTIFVNINMEKMTLEDSFNMIVNLARQSKLTHQEHQAVEEAVNVLLEILKEKN